MNWAGITSTFLLATVKFLFAPFTAVHLGMHYYETYFASVAGGIFGSFFFYFGSDFLLAYAAKRYAKKLLWAKQNNTTIKVKKKFTKMNRFILRIKSTFGKIGICFWAPFFLSVPIGSIVVAKFYGNEKFTFLWIMLGMFLNAIVTTFLSYVIFR
jgi:uncharacterized membrane protein